jgi:hypothetical protein
VVRWTDWGGFKLTAAKLLKSPRAITVHQVKEEDGAILVARVER